MLEAEALTSDEVPPEARLSARQNARLRERLSALLKREGLSERKLADRAGVSIGAVRGVGTTVRGPTLGTLLALAKALKVSSIEELLGPSSTTLLSKHDQLEAALGEDAMAVVMNSGDEPTAAVEAERMAL